jgi:hypothetical protein
LRKQLPSDLQVISAQIRKLVSVLKAKVQMRALEDRAHCNVGHFCPKNSADKGLTVAKFNFMKILRLKSSRNSDLRDPLPAKLLFFNTMPKFFLQRATVWLHI